MPGGDEIGNGCKVRPRIGGQGHADYIFSAELSYFPAAADAFGVGVKNDFKKYCWIIGAVPYMGCTHGLLLRKNLRCSRVIILIPVGKNRQVNLMVN